MGIGNKLKYGTWLGKAGIGLAGETTKRFLAREALEYTIDVGVGTGYDMYTRDESFSTAFGSNAVGSLIGKGVGHGLSAAGRAFPRLNPQNYTWRTNTAGMFGGIEAEFDGPRGVRAGGADRLMSVEYTGGRTTLYHYTDEAGLDGILTSKELWASRGYQHARYGDGQYLADIAPESIVALRKADLSSHQLASGQISLGQLAHKFYRRGTLTNKVSHFVEIDISDLAIRHGLNKDGKSLREAVQFLLNDGSLDVSNRIIRFGKVLE
ncbi:MAG: HYD1 signature containing ADP-ribosyltransferase family protein [Planctomycetaceae bacterium]